MEIIYHGHSCVQISDQGQSLIVDPFISGNPLAKTNVNDIGVQYILLTHGHEDHILDAVTIAKQNNAQIIATFELATYLGWQGASVIPMNLGGTYDFGFGTVQLTHAFHSSGYVLNKEQQIIYLGMPAGLLIGMNDKVLYHAGDTGLFSDMKLIGELNDIDLAFLPIGDHFTMGPKDALVAAEWLKAKSVVPVHFDTFPPIVQDARRFVEDLNEIGVHGRALLPGESLVIN